MILTFERSRKADLSHVDLRHNMREVARRHGKSILAQLTDMAPLVLAGKRISPSDYYRHQLYDDARFSAADKREFLGENRYWELLFRISDWRWCAMTDDKLICSAILANHGFRVPVNRAVFHHNRSYPGVRALDSAAALTDFLRDETVYPLFGKPVAGFESRATVHLKGYECASDELLLNDGQRVSVARLVDELVSLSSQHCGDLLRFGPGLGYLFQRVVTQHPMIEARCGTSCLASIRIPVILEQSGPRILAPYWRIPAPSNITDQTAGPGNLVATVDPASGRVTRVARGVGVDLEEFEHNPYTQERLVGMIIPFFEELTAAVLKGATIFPGIRFQGWDAVITPDGPMILEINNGSAYKSIQLASRKGVYDSEFADFVAWAESQNVTKKLMLWSKWLGPLHRLGPLHGAWHHVVQLLRGSRKPD